MPMNRRFDIHLIVNTDNGRISFAKAQNRARYAAVDGHSGRSVTGDIDCGLSYAEIALSHFAVYSL